MLRQWAGVSGVVGWFVYLAHRALSFGFNPDDEMNINFAIFRPLKLNLESIPFFWNGYIRPLGNAFYLVVYRGFGYWAPPYRIAAFFLISLNLVLLYRFAKTLTGSVTAAGLVILAGCFHREMWDIYASTGTVYDVLCQLFILLALTIWVESHPRNHWPTVLAIALLTVAAVDSKELGVALPAVLLTYDLLFRRTAIRYASIGAATLVAVVFLLGRFAQPTAVTGNAAYTPVLTLSHFAMTTQWYLDLLIMKPGISVSAAFCILAGGAALALALRDRILLFGLAYYLLTLLPMSFAPARSGYALYIPQTGALLFAAALFLRLRLLLPAFRPALTGIAALGIMSAQVSASRTLITARVEPAFMPQLELLTSAMRREFPNLPAGAQVTLVNDAFSDVYVPLFTLRASYNDPTLMVERVRWNPALGPEQLHDAPRALFFAGLHAWRFGALDESGQRVDGRPRESVAMSSALASLNLVKDVAEDPTPEGSRWAFADPEFVFSRPAGPSEFALEYEVPGAVLDRTGPLRLSFSVDQSKPEQVEIASAGQRRYTRAVSGTGDPLVRVKIHSENPYIGSAGEKLSFLVTWAGLRKTK